METRIFRQFAAVAGRQVHYRRAGRGPPVLLLHQSPTSSRECEPMMRQLAQRHSVFAPDMPGYGASDPLPRPIRSIEELADGLAGFMDALGIDRAGIFGFHTGASIANSFARRHAPRVAVSVLLGLLCPDAAEREDLLQYYTPPFVAQWDGSHLAWAWSRLKDQSVFFPWYRREADGRVTMDASAPPIIQAALRDWLRSGERYRDAYRAAFRYRPECDLPYIVTPHFILGYPSDPIFGHLQRLPPLPAVACIRRHGTMAEAQRDATELLHRFAGVGQHDASTPAVWVGQHCPQDYLGLSGVQLRTLRAGDSARPPLLLLHGAQSSVTAWRDLCAALGRSRSVIALELPGHGESDPLPEGRDYSIGDLSDLVRDALKTLGLAQLDFVGIEAGGAILAVLAARGQVSVRSLCMVGAIDVSENPGLRDALLASYPAEVPPDFFGGHLLRAWHEARDHSLFFPWYERRKACATLGDAPPDTQSLHKQTVDALLAGGAGYAIRKSEIRCALTSHLVDRKCEARTAAGRWSPRFAQTQALAAASRLNFRRLPRHCAAWTAALMEPDDA